MKRSFFQIILLSVFGALAVAGVLVFSFAVSGGNQSAQVGAVVIWGTLDSTAFNAVLQHAADLNPELQQVTYIQKDPATFEQDLVTALAQNDGPDMYILPSDSATHDEPTVVPLLTYDQFSVAQFQNLYAEGANVYLGKDGIIGLPFAIDPLVLYWNRDLFASAGLAEPPQYWEDVQQVAPELTTKDSTGQIQKSAIALGTYQNIPDAKDILAAMMLQEGAPITTKTSTGALSAAMGQSAATPGQNPGQSALTFYTSFADPSQNFYSWSGAMQDARAAFAAGDVAMYIGYASEASLISQMNPNLNFAVAQMPQFKSAPRATDFGRVYAFAVPRVAKNAVGAALAAELLDSATTTTAFANSFGIAGARRDVLSGSAVGDQALFNTMAIQVRTWADPDPVQTSDLFRAMIENTISGASTAQESVDQGDEQMAHIINPSGQ